MLGPLSQKCESVPKVDFCRFPAHFLGSAGRGGAKEVLKPLSVVRLYSHHGTAAVLCCASVWPEGLSRARSGRPSMQQRGRQAKEQMHFEKCWTSC